MEEYPDAEADLQNLMREIHARSPQQGQRAHTQINVARDNGLVFGAQGGNVYYYASTTPSPPLRSEADSCTDGDEQ